MIYNEKLFNYNFVDYIESYNFGIGHVNNLRLFENLNFEIYELKR